MRYLIAIILAITAGIVAVTLLRPADRFQRSLGGTVDPASLYTFSQRLLEEVEADSRATTQKSGREGGVMVDLLSTDIKASDSTLHPRVGVITFKLRVYGGDRKHGIYIANTKVYTLNMAKDAGKWVLVGGTVQVTQDDVIYPHKSDKAGVGPAVPIGTDVFAREIRLANY